MITNLIFSIILCPLYQSEVPYKPFEEFELKVNYIFKEQVPIDRQKVILDQSAKEKSRMETFGAMPYLTIELKVLTVSDDEIRIRVVNNNGTQVLNRKTSAGTIIKLDWGFTEDIKDKISPNEFTVFFTDKAKKSVSKIFLTILDDGIFMVNEEKRGKF